MSDKQKTIKKPVSLQGVGLHTGRDVVMTFKPAPENHGFKFLRTDLEEKPVIDALAENAADTTRGTTIEKDGVRIATVEHSLAALAGLEIDNAIIEINGPETPIMDGSARFFVEALLEAGIEEQTTDRNYYNITEPVEYRVDEKDSEIVAVPADRFKISSMIDYNTSVLKIQHAQMDDISEFKEGFSRARTFVFLHELEQLFTQEHLIRGGNLNNAIVFVNKKISQGDLDHIAEKLGRDSVDVMEEGILNNLELEYENEPARHKLLDILGDLALIGRPLKGYFIAKRPGHKTNVEFASMIRKKIMKDEHQKEKEAPQIDWLNPPLYDINKIKNILPHRPPFLLIDRVYSITGNEVIGMKNVTMNESFFVGHFPEEPLMPGVLQIEAMAQAGGILALHQVEDPQEYSTYFLKIDKVRFRKKVEPGDTLVFKLTLVSPIRRGLCHMEGKAFVGDTIVTEADLLAQITRKK
ncbi:MAG: bifunctional UDP-3-O-[3-hydroxymyristoyl] N-acetylglucosamine deacetylase/3-hydroxyacyl-ACP dehydratase [Bacteroidales bacterium]|nr:bifunctional UDP-3-O-[3-hydroxymyristoyl] N-acetylglucosamine deacetylase/3-hydroxyacyl-ACP dehydratase [Bacteroidales bacterium]